MSTLRTIWEPLRSELRTIITSTYSDVTSHAITTGEGEKIEKFLYNYCEPLMDCDMSFDSSVTTNELNDLLRHTFKQKIANVVTQWQLINAALEIDSGKDVHEESFYAVADTPQIQNKDYNEFAIKQRQFKSLMENSQSVREFYNEIKLLVVTLY